MELQLRRVTERSKNTSSQVVRGGGVEWTTAKLEEKSNVEEKILYTGKRKRSWLT